MFLYLNICQIIPLQPPSLFSFATLLIAVRKIGQSCNSSFSRVFIQMEHLIDNLFLLCGFMFSKTDSYAVVIK